ncbi:MAG TPA: hypothetical protein VNO17_08530 [Actinomycetota bacterium]|nr:hypothetical protein [Actinomycetota bacterium]
MPKATFDPDSVPVTLEELEARTGLPIEAIEARLNGTPVAADWAGRKVIPGSAARRLVEDHRREIREHEEREAARRAAAERWQRERERVFQEAFEAALPGFVREELAAMSESFTGFVLASGVPSSTPTARARAQEAAREAVQRWERRNPRPE